MNNDEQRYPLTGECKECEAFIDLTGCEELAAYVTLCDACATQENHRSEKRERAKKAQARRKARAMRAEAIIESTIPKGYRKTRIDHPDYPVELHHSAMDWLKLLDAGKDSPIWMGIIGTSGRGKTRVASQVAIDYMHRGRQVAWINAARFQWNAQKQHDRVHGAQATARLDSFLKADLLVFDDLGKQQWTPVVEAQFYDLVEHRYGAELPMIWTSNSSLKDLRGMLTIDRADPIIGRLAETSLILEI